MTAMLPPHPSLRASSAPPAEKFGDFLWPAAVTLVLHGAILTLLLGHWSPGEPVVANEKLLKTQWVTIHAAPQPEPAPLSIPRVEPPPPQAPAPTPSPAPVVERPAEPPKPTIDQGAIARQRAREAEQRELARAQEQRRMAEQRRQEQVEQEQQQLLAAQAAAQAAQAAEAQRQRAAEERRRAEAARLTQYQPISKKPPAYPKRALDQRKEGDCTVEYTVTAQGTVHNPVVVEGGCDDPVFARPSLSSARSFRYKPRMVDGVAVAVPGVRNTFRFRLEQ
ncbi:energy transducer TonB [Ectothiorhodospira lacustris]|uniref:energy transducer TonB n=1 Tax=Ectothiorhodospira lacustris TaxID=2899127 RepID=UPI001EE7A330|nr:energy transducer TonB [Ectothiorhodospira lacustris]MCG5511132.1 TonB family protein [Ectothiorhodospira lacustris]MCG5522796.1 TonB family protein [Ectothiorhodospira lacustris]